MNTLNRPPFPQKDLGIWARQMYEYLSSQSPVKGTVDPTAILLPHITSEQMPRAATDGVLLFDPSSGQVVVSIGGVFVDLGPYTLALPDVITPGSAGDADSIPQITVDAKGRVTALSAVDVSIAASKINDSSAAGRAMLTAADAAAQTALLDVFTDVLQGLVPASGGETTDFLRADGSFEPIDYIGQLTADYALVNTSATQQLFDFSANGALTLPTGRYAFECAFRIDDMSATSGNAAFSLEGTATLAAIGAFYAARDLDGTLGAPTSTFITTNSTVVNMAVASAGTGLAAFIKGMFDVTVTGTIIPSINLVTAIGTAKVLTGSYFTCRRVADTGDNVVGPWS